MSDYISRETAKLAVVDAAQSSENGFQWGETVTFTPSEIIGLIEKIPAADVRPVVRGRWILDSDPGEPWRYICSECGEKTTDTCMGEPRANFFPNCGAKMEELE